MAPEISFKGGNPVVTNGRMKTEDCCSCFVIGLKLVGLLPLGGGGGEKEAEGGGEEGRII